MKNKIDFVIAWVDGNDEKWQEEKAKYSPQQGTDSNVNRYRDWDNLRYWFRGVEKYAPWVNKIFFVHGGMYPSGLMLIIRRYVLLITGIICQRNICHALVRIRWN